MNRIELPKQVKNENDEVYALVAVLLSKNGTDNMSIPVDNFVAKYTEYFDPKDIEIARLKAIIDELNAPKKIQRKRLLKGEWKEIDELILKGEGNMPIAREYGISDSAVSKRRIEMRKNGKDV